jgi:lysozyme
MPPCADIVQKFSQKDIHGIWQPGYVNFYGSDGERPHFEANWGKRMKISQNGIDLIKHFEGLRLESYQDVAGIWTIGYGHTGPEVGPNQTISEAEAEQLLRKDLNRFEQGVASMVRVDIDQNQFDALVSLAFNIGLNAFRGSTALRLLNRGDLLGAAEAMTWWNKATINGVKREVLGLVRRRAAEAALFLQNVTAAGDDAADDSSRVAAEENSPRRGNVLGSRTVEGAVIAGAGGAAGAGAAMMGGDDDEDEEGGEEPITEPPAEEQPTDPPVDNPAENPVDEQPTEQPETPDPQPEETPEETPTEETGTETQVPPAGPQDDFQEADYTQAFQIAAGVIVILGVLYVLFARFDDWFKFRR